MSDNRTFLNIELQCIIVLILNEFSTKLTNQAEREKKLAKPLVLLLLLQCTVLYLFSRGAYLNF